MIVIKAGGGTTLDIDAIVADIVTLRPAGTELLLVHGGAQTTNAVAEALGHPPQFVTSESGHVSRRTDRRTLEIFEMVYCGQLNKMWVEKLQRLGVNAVGLSGLDGRIFEGHSQGDLAGASRWSPPGPTGRLDRNRRASECGVAPVAPRCGLSTGIDPARIVGRRRRDQCRW